MPDYKKYKCPVCNKQFKDGDDIVVCPECGTPHHRECYKLTGHCVNQGLHKSGYGFIDSEKEKQKTEEEKETAKSFEGEYSGDYYYSPDDDFVAQAKKEAQEKKQASTDNDNTDGGFFSIPTIQVDESLYKMKGTIDGLSIADIAATVRTNISRFIQVFKRQSKTKKKAGWNWAAFLFGSFYLLFRKMYKQGVAFFCLAMTSIIAGEAFILKFAPKYVSAVQDFVTQYASNPSGISTADAQKLLTTSDAINAQKIVYIILGILLVLRIIEAIFADYFYKGTVANIIKNVTQQLDEGASFSQTALFFNQDRELDQTQMRRMYLANKGGVTLFAPFLAYFIMYILITYL